jgi:hypothetical protein
MCYSEEVSLATFLIGIFGSICVYTLGSTFDHIVAFFLGYVAFMQAIEWLLWRHQQCDDYHKQVSVAGMILNWSQPIVLGGLILGLSPRKEYTSIIIASMASYFAYSIYYIRQYTSNLQCTQPKDEDPHLVWNWTVLDSFPLMWSIFIATFFIVSVLGMPTLRQGLSFGATAVITMALSIVVYERQDVGAMWCFFTSFIPLSYYIIRKVGFL